ncbi:MAG TPA: Lrp/AsnC family transcriptional regulator [Rhizomicrobium sp.]|jgi:Lrp/AsnC family leucine-responsive transcriptional regulator|nr:Lrp/AsnC family transcriptional regulator [Rhizomicrobium sp.]
MELDRIDRKLLEAVQRNNQLPTKQLGDLVGLSATACQRRLKRLREEGVIEADVAVVAHAAAGRPLLMLVSVTLERERADVVDRLKRAIRDTPEIMSGYYVTGDADFVLVISARDMDDFDTFTRRFFYNMPDIKGFKTMVVIDRVKASFILPLADK